MINKMAKDALGEIYVFADARQRFEKNAISELVRCFADPAVGAVSGELVLEDRDAGAGRGIGLYWRYEKAMRRMESAVGSMLGATGAIYAVRKEHFHYLPENIILDDLYTPFNAIVVGQRAIFEPAARAYDLVVASVNKEFTRKVRTLVGNFQIFAVFPEAFNPFKSRIALQLFSHKFLRLMVPYALVLFFISGISLSSVNPFCLLASILQLIFYILAWIGQRLEKSGRHITGPLRLAYIPYEFCVLNLAAVVALKRYLAGQVEVAWQK
jgi:biofilm PGA synthesis N-glycosyltransferase PgaC